MTDQPKRRPHRKRQLIGLLLVSIVVCYPLSIGPWSYAWGRGWVPLPVRRASWYFYQPAYLALKLIPSKSGYSLAYYWIDWERACFERGERDRSAR